MLWLHKFAQADNVALSGFPHILLGTKANDRMAFEGVDVTRRDCRKSEPFANAFAIGYVLVSRDRLALDSLYIDPVTSHAYQLTKVVSFGIC